MTKGLCFGMMALLAIAVLGMGGLSCDQASTTTSTTADDPDKETPESLARENNKQAEEELAASDKGKDDDGDKIWKQEARDYFDFKKNPANRTFKMPPQFARDFIEKSYAAGAEKIWVTTISASEIGGRTINMSDTLVVVLPTDSTKRKAIFAIHDKVMKDADEDPIKDIGQKYICLVAD